VPHDIKDMALCTNVCVFLFLLYYIKEYIYHSFILTVMLVKYFVENTS